MCKKWMKLIKFKESNQKATYLIRKIFNWFNSLLELSNCS